MTNENPYEPSQLNDSPQSARRFIATPALFLTTIALAVVAGVTVTYAGKLWEGLIFICPAVAILIAASRFGSLAVKKSFKFAAVFLGVSVASYIAFAATCSGVNIASIQNVHSIDTESFGFVTSVTTLLGCLMAFLLSQRFLRK